MKNTILLLLLCGAMITTAHCQEAGFNQMVAQFFEYDRNIPLNVKELEKMETETYTRQRIVFDGIRNSRVPGYIAVPKGAAGVRYPCILLFHSGISSKESWWEEESFEHGKKMVGKLIANGFAVLALDAQYYGARAFENDYVGGFDIFAKHNHFNKYRELMVQTTVEYRKALDYLATRNDIDANRIGAFGTSVGGNMALTLSTVDERVKTIVVCSSIIHGLPQPIGVFAPINAKPLNSAAAVLLQVGKTDDFSPEEQVQKVFKNLQAKSKDLKKYEFGHAPDESYLEDALRWFKNNL